MSEYDSNGYKFSRPARHVKALNVGPIPQRIFDGMSKYNDTARGMSILPSLANKRPLTTLCDTGFAIKGFEISRDNARGSIIVAHRPDDAQVSQIYRIPSDPSSTELERLTYFDIGSGRLIQSFTPILGEDWRKAWRAGGAVMVMDLTGNENFQLWRYWEDADSEVTFPRIEDELDNRPGKGRFERLTHDDYSYHSVIVSLSNRLLVFASTKENGKDTLVYATTLINSDTGARADSNPFLLPSRVIAPKMEDLKGMSYWIPESISVDDKHVALTMYHGHSYRPLYIVDITATDGKAPELVTLPDVTERAEETSYSSATFSRDPTQAHVLYLITNAFGDFASVVAYDTLARTVVNITTPEPPDLRPLRQIPWETGGLLVTPAALFFYANVEGWQTLYALPLSGAGSLAPEVLEVRMRDWEGSPVAYAANVRNDRPNELVVHFNSFRMNGFLASIDFTHVFEDGAEPERDEFGNFFVSVAPRPYRQATPSPPRFKVHPPKLLKFKSFDGLEVPCMYYHPEGGKTAVPVVIQIHGGPASQSTAETRVFIHGYLLNELGCAVIYPNVRGSTGYGKRYCAMDDVFKREDSVNDIGALLDHIDQNMKGELIASRVAVMGGSYGGYMVYASLVHFSPKLTCGLANFGIAHWPSFLERTADRRRDQRRQEYGDERDADVRAFLERISPLNNAERIAVPLSIAHGEEDSRVPVGEALRLWDIANKKVYMELMVCELEGHGFIQKSVIEFTNAAKIHFLERFLLPNSSVSSNL
ncbi:Alpha/Beta hydrolase protein [Russula earlei]|uniref:Alpha/Beta hydrolase protein n=1 Tax=Russula earlei TaxID=71964 RepID=A0ACC0UKF0_9AGAM|nr:Alpha/Beta hydrolase protein [Russula earlei]